MKFQRSLFSHCTFGLLAAASFLFVGCETVGPDARVVVPNTTINGQPVRLVMDTGSFTSALTMPGARRLGLPVTPIPDFTVNSNGAMSMAASVNVALGTQSFTERLPVLPMLNLPWYVRNSADLGGLGDGVIGWPEFRNNILIFDPEHRTVRAIAALPPETADWIKLKVQKKDQLFLEVSLVEGKIVSLQVDTGSAAGLCLPTPLWKEWRSAHPDAPTTISTSAAIGDDAVKAEVAWADKVSLGPLTLTDVSVKEQSDTNIGEDPDDLAGLIGLHGLARMDLVVDAKNGFAYLHPRPPPGLPDPALKISGAAQDDASEKAWNQDWTFVGNLSLNLSHLHSLSAYADGEIKRKKGDLTGAIAVFTKAIEIDPDEANLYLDRAEVLHDHNDDVAAVADYSRTLELNPKSTYTLNERGLAKMDLADYDGALADFNLVLERDPHFAVGYGNRYSVELKLDEYDAAIADMEHLLTIDPKNPSAFVARAFAKIFKGDYVDALADLNRALDFDSKFPNAYALRGLIQQIKADFPAALADFDQAIKFDRTNSDNSRYVQIYRQSLLRRMGKPPEDLTASVAKWKDSWLKCIGQFVIGQMDEAALLAAADKLYGETTGGQKAEAYYYIGMQRLLGGDTMGARDFFQKCLATNAKGYDVTIYAQTELARLNATADKPEIPAKPLPAPK